MKRLVMIENVPAQDKGEPLGLYVHIPFCSSTCDFCAFYQKVPDKSDIETFLATARQELHSVRWSRKVSTVFWGGGTPGILSPAALQTLGEDVLSVTEGPPVEWTVEMAPKTVTKARLETLKSLGVTRISLGVQSFQTDLLDALGRQHSRLEIDRAWDLIQQADFHSVNVDLMFALPGQTEAAWKADLEEAVRREPDHLSTYCLTFEEDTALWIKLSKGLVKLDPEKEARFYRDTWAFLETAGYPQYEVSNFSLPGYQCLHNVNTWKLFSWVGIGPSAASQMENWRGANPADLGKWSQNIGAGLRMSDDRVALTSNLLGVDRLVFGLRMNEGILVPQLKESFPDLAWEEIDGLFSTMVSEGLANLALDQQLILTTRGRLLADTIGSEIMSVAEPSVPTES